MGRGRGARWGRRGRWWTRARSWCPKGPTDSERWPSLRCVRQQLGGGSEWLTRRRDASCQWPLLIEHRRVTGHATAGLVYALGKRGTMRPGRGARSATSAKQHLHAHILANSNRSDSLLAAETNSTAICVLSVAGCDRCPAGVRACEQLRRAGPATTLANACCRALFRKPSEESWCAARQPTVLVVPPKTAGVYSVAPAAACPKIARECA